MNKKTNWKWPRLAAVMLGIFLIMVVSQSTATAQAGNYIVELHPPHVGATNPGFEEGECPVGPTDWGWHFVAPPGGTIVAGDNTFFDFQNDGRIHAFISHPTSQHAYVYTSGPDTLLGAQVEILAGTNAQKLVLSHVCPGESEPELYPFRVVKYHDMNANATEDAGEPRLAGWTFNWTSSDGQSGQLITGADGTATTANMFEAGVTVQVTEVVQPGWYLTTPNPAGTTIIVGTAEVKFGNNYDTPSGGTLTGTPTCAVLTVNSTYAEPVTGQVFVDNMDTPAWTGQINPGTTPFTLGFSDNQVHTVKLRWADPAEGWKELVWNIGPCGEGTGCDNTFDTITVYAQWIKTGLPVRDVTITDFRNGAAGTPVLTSKDQGHVTYWVEQDTSFNITAELIDPPGEEGLWEGYSIELIQSPEPLPIQTHRCEEHVIYVLVNEPGPETNCVGASCVRLNVEVALQQGLTTGFHEPGRLDVYEQLQHADGRIETGRWIASVRVEPGWKDMTFVLPHWVTGPTHVEVYWVPDSTGTSVMLEIVNGNWVDPAMEHALEIVPPPYTQAADNTDSSGNGGVAAAIIGTLATIASLLFRGGPIAL